MNGMRKLAWILGIIAFCASVFLIVSSFIAIRGRRQAAEDVSAYRMAAELEAESDQTSIHTDLLKIETDQALIETDKLEGKKTSTDEAKLSADRWRLSSDEDKQKMNQSPIFGQDPKAASAQHSLDVYSAVLVRNYHMAYAVFFLWIAFGFALALSTKRKSNPESVASD